MNSENCVFCKITQGKIPAEKLGESNNFIAIKDANPEGSIMKFGDAPKVDINVIPTGSIGLDMALGVGGIPRGRIIEIHKRRRIKTSRQKTRRRF